MECQVGESGSGVNGENRIRCQTSSDIDPHASIDRRLPLPPDAFSGDITAMLGFTRLQGCTHDGPTRGRGGWAIPFHDKSVRKSVVVGSRVGSPFSSVAFPPLPTTVILVPSSLKLFVKLSLGTAD